MKKSSDNKFLYIFIFLFLLGFYFIFGVESKTYGDNLTGIINKVEKKGFFNNTYYIEINNEIIYCTKTEFEQLLEGKKYEIYWISSTRDKSGRKKLYHFVLKE